jgi:hypothetical protein
MEFEHDPEAAARALRQYRVAEGMDAEGPGGDRIAPEPLFQPLPAPAPFPVEALGPLTEAVEAATEIAQAPVEIAALTALTTASLCVHTQSDVEALPLGSHVPTSLFGVTLAKSGERKGTVEGLLLDGVRAHERAAIRKYEADFKVYERALGTWLEKKKQADRAAGNIDEVKSKKGETALRKLPPEPQPPDLPYVLASEPTAEGLWKLLYYGGPSIGLFNEEGGAFLGGYAMGPEKRLQMMSFLNRLWNGEMVDRHRVHDGSASAEGRLAMHIMVQPDIAAPLLADVQAQASGFWARGLICQPESLMGTRFYDPDNPAPDEARRACSRFADRCESLLGRARDHVTEDGELQLPKLALSKGAARRLADYNNEIEVGMASGGLYASLTAQAGKSAQQAARIAGVMTLFEDEKAQEVGEDRMADAIALARYFLEETRRLFEGSATDPQMREADGLRLWLIERWPEIAGEKGRDPGFVTPRDIMQWRGRPKEANAVRALMAILCQHGWAEPADGQLIGGVKARTAWRIWKS